MVSRQLFDISRTFAEAPARHLRLVIAGSPPGIQPVLLQTTLFGRSGG